jgi:Ribonuclease G/E
MVKSKDRISDRAERARPYVERALRDEDVRENLKSALVAARNVYDELLGGRGVTTVATRVATDKEIQDSLRKAIEELRRAADRVQGKKESHTGRNMLLLAGIAIGILYNPVTGPATRQWLSNLISGSDEDLEQQFSTTDGN